MKMNLKKIREAFAQILLSFSEVSTDKGILAWDSEGELKEGDEVFAVKEDGSREKAEDGDYTAEDGKVISVVEGKVASIKDPEAEVAPAAEPIAEPAAMEEVIETPAVVEEPAIVEEPVNDDEKAIIEKLEEIANKIASLEERIAKLEESPAAEPAVEEFKKAVKPVSTGNSHADFLSRLAAAGRN